MPSTINPDSLSDIEWRPATVEDINGFYRTAFMDLVKDMPVYLINPWHPSEYGFAPLYPIKTKSGERKFLRRTNTTVRSFGDLRNMCLDFEKYDPTNAALMSQPMTGIYFGLNGIREYGWLLAFDIDAKHIASKGLCPYHDGYADIPKPDANSVVKEITRIPPISPVDGHEYVYCFNCILESIKQAQRTKDILVEWGFDERLITIYYSGQGAHIHVTDPECWTYSKEARYYIQTMLIEKYDIPLDPVITCDEKRVLRLPGSLNGNVNRPVIPITDKNHHTFVREVLKNVNPITTPCLQCT